MQGNKIMLAIAVVAGVMATVLAFTYINSVTSAADAQVPEAKELVLFVLTDLPANVPLDPETHLREVEVPKSSPLARAAVKAEERDALRGQRISSPLPAGVPLLYSHLAPVTDIDLPSGTRAMSIDVSGANLMGGILVPGDHVDILVSYMKKKDLPEIPVFDAADPGNAMGQLMASALGQAGAGSVPSDWEVEEVLTDIRVIAIGESLSVSRQAHMFGMGGGGGGGSSIVTLELTPDQSKKLIRAQAGGANKLTLLLRPVRQSIGAGGGSFEEG